EALPYIAPSPARDCRRSPARTQSIARTSARNDERVVSAMMDVITGAKVKRRSSYRSRVNLLRRAGYRRAADVRCTFVGRSRLHLSGVKAVRGFFASAVSNCLAQRRLLREPPRPLWWHAWKCSSKRERLQRPIQAIG